MNSWSENIPLSRPLRDAPLAGQAAPPSPEDLRQAELKARYQLGLADGEKALTEKLIQQRAELHELVQGLLQSLRLAVPQVIRETERTMVSLALAVSQKLVADLPISHAMVEAAVRDALAQVEGAARFTVRLHRADLELLQKAGSPLLTTDEGQEFRFLPSPDVSRGGCLVETNFGTVDGRRETKFDLLKRNLLT
ncbi:MAG: FliH/SctL family protein [Verrucomicrobiota bacterium]|jgi:flagellar assembly protein FliH